MTSDPYASTTLAGVDVQQAREEIAEAGVSAPTDMPEAAAELQEVVDGARTQGIDLSVVVVPADQWGRHLGRLVAYPERLRNLSTAVGEDSGGTILALSPNQIGSYSAVYSRFTLESAEHAAQNEPAPSLSITAERFVHKLEHQDSIPWTALSVVLLAVVVVVVALGTAWNVHSARPQR